MFKRAGDAAAALGVSKDYLKRVARQGGFPEGSVRSTDGGHYTYNVDMIAAWMVENYKRQTRVSRMEARS